MTSCFYIYYIFILSTGTFFWLIFNNNKFQSLKSDNINRFQVLCQIHFILLEILLHTFLGNKKKEEENNKIRNIICIVCCKTNKKGSFCSF